MTNRFSNGMYKMTSRKQDAIAQELFRSFHENGCMVTLGTQLNCKTGGVTYDYELNNVTILKIHLSHNGEFIPMRAFIPD